MSSGYIEIEGSPARICINYPAFDVEDLESAIDGLEDAESLGDDDKERIIRSLADDLELADRLVSHIDLVICDEAREVAERYIAERDDVTG